MDRSLPGSLRRLSDEVRAACRDAVAAPSASAAPGLGHRIALGGWLGAVRQPQGEFASLVIRSRRAGAALEEPRSGDLSRTHIMRLKGERAALEDGLDRSRRYQR